MDDKTTTTRCIMWCFNQYAGFHLEPGPFQGITIIVNAWGFTILWIPKWLAVLQILPQTFINVNFVET